MSVQNYLTGWVTNKLLKIGVPIGLLLLLMYQCNKGCNREPQLASVGVFDYKSIAVSLPRLDTIPVDTLAAEEDLKNVITIEMIEFAKTNSSQFVKFLGQKYKVSNGYIEKVE